MKRQERDFSPARPALDSETAARVDAIVALGRPDPIEEIRAKHPEHLHDAVYTAAFVAARLEHAQAYRAIVDARAARREASVSYPSTGRIAAALESQREASVSYPSTGRIAQALESQREATEAAQRDRIGEAGAEPVRKSIREVLAAREEGGDQ